MSAAGTDLSELERLFGVTIPETKSFSLETVLSILNGNLSVSKLFAELEWLDSELELAGDIADIRDLMGIDITATHKLRACIPNIMSYNINIEITKWQNIKM